MDSFLGKCNLRVLSSVDLKSEDFSCGDYDLDNFLHNEATLYEDNLLGKTYCYTLKDNPNVVVCYFTVSNDSLRVDYLPSSRKQKINKNVPRQKQMRRYPAVLIGRIAVSLKFSRKHIGTDMLTFIKQWFIRKNNKTGCRYLIVDAYNTQNTIDFYLSNGFNLMFSTEEQEAINLNVAQPLKTRFMYFDLMNIKRSE